MFGIGPQEMFIILVVALVVFGPKRLPELAGQVGRWVREFRKMSADLTGEFDKTFAEVEDVRRSFQRELSGIKDEVEGVSKSVKRDLGGASGSKAARPATRASSTATTAKKTGLATNGQRASAATTVPVATKADPLADVSVLDDVSIKPGRAAVSANGAAAEEAVDAALARVRQRRAAAGYARRS